MKTKTPIKFIILSTLLSAALFSCGKENDPSSVEFTLCQFDGPVSIHTDTQKAFFQETDFSTDLKEYGLGEVENTYPLPIRLSWNVIAARKYIVKVSEKNDMSNAKEYATSSRKLDLYNAKVGTTYYWTVDAIYKSNTFTSEVASFSTLNDGARNIYVDGVNNMRDLGGYVLANGKTFKQGLIYRSAKFNESSIAQIKKTITNKGLKQIEDLGIKTDIDLRKTEPDEKGIKETSGLTSSPLGNDVNYYNCPLLYEGDTVIAMVNNEKDAFNKSNIKKMFDYMSDESNYPMVFHCTQGKDRTGALSYLIESLLGVSENDKVRDYLFTNMSSIGGGYCKYTAIRGYRTILNKYQGEDISEKAFNYLLSIGVSENNINAIIDILSE